MLMLVFWNSAHITLRKYHIPLFFWNWWCRCSFMFLFHWNLVYFSLSFLQLYDGSTTIMVAVMVLTTHGHFVYELDPWKVWSGLFIIKHSSNCTCHCSWPSWLALVLPGSKFTQLHIINWDAKPALGCVSLSSEDRWCLTLLHIEIKSVSPCSAIFQRKCWQWSHQSVFIINLRVLEETWGLNFVWGKIWFTIIIYFFYKKMCPLLQIMLGKGLVGM